MTKNFYEIAVQIQNASNPIAVTGELREAMMSAHGKGDLRKNPAVLALFFKLYDMLGSPSEKEMYTALKQCEALTQSPKTVGGYGSKKIRTEKKQDAIKRKSFTKFVKTLGTPAAKKNPNVW